MCALACRYGGWASIALFEVTLLKVKEFCLGRSPTGCPTSGIHGSNSGDNSDKERALKSVTGRKHEFAPHHRPAGTTQSCAYELGSYGKVVLIQ